MPRTPQRLPKSHPRTATRKKRGGGASPNRTRAVPGWLWLVAGVGVGMLVTSLIKLADVPPPTDGTGGRTAKVIQPSSGREDRPPAGSEDKAEPAKSETRFDFYTLLPEREVIVPDQREVQPATPPRTAPGKPPRPATPTAPTERYLLQAGSFRGQAEADRRRAQILLLGLDARIEPVHANGDTWYRVHTGPFVSSERLADARELLSDEGIETLLLKQKPAG